MRKKGNIHALVHALTKTEKRYVKVFAKLHGDNLNYIKLLEAVEEQVQYDEDAIKGQFKDEPFAKQLHVTKNYLQSLILKALRNFYHHPLSRAELLDMLRNIEILFEKGLKDHVEFYLLKGIRWSREIECFDLQLSFLDWQKKWLQSFWSDAFREHSRFMDRDFQSCLKNLMNLDEYRHLYDSMDRLLSGSRIADGYYSDEVVGSALMETSRKALSVRARIIYFKILFRYYYVHKKNLQRAIGEGKKLVEIGKEHPQLLIHHLEDFLEGMWSIIRALFRNQETQLLQEFLSELSKIFQTLQKGHSFSNIHINQLEVLSWQLRILEFSPDSFKQTTWDREFKKEIENHKAKSFSKSLAKALVIKAWKEYKFGEYDRCKEHCTQILEEFNYPIYIPYRNAALMFLLFIALKSNRVPSLKMNFKRAKGFWARESKEPLSNRRKVFGSIISGKKENWKDLLSKAIQGEKRKQEKQFLSGINEKEIFIFFGEQYLKDV